MNFEFDIFVVSHEFSLLSLSMVNKSSCMDAIVLKLISKQFLANTFCLERRLFLLLF